MKHKHYDLIVEAAANTDIVVFCNNSIHGTWGKAATPYVWHPINKYKLIYPEYLEAWNAYIDGELEFYSSGWVDWKEYCSNCHFDKNRAPFLKSSPDKYRRKGSMKIEITVNGNTVDPSSFSEESWKALRK